ncbi:MAG: hypothetical protein QG670_1485 [Thermoproteota archaeon]|nr:hypothetical protein [Thermoproteota archaeon]
MSEPIKRDEKGIIHCSICGCLFFAESDYVAHMKAFGTDSYVHFDRFKRLHPRANRPTSEDHHEGGAESNPQETHTLD